MAPSSSDVLSGELTDGAMDFATPYSPIVLAPPPAQSFADSHHQQQQQQHPQLQQQQPEQEQLQSPPPAPAPPQTFRADSYHSQQQQHQQQQQQPQPLHAFASDGPQQQPSRAQHQPGSQHQQFNGHSYQPQQVFAAESSSQRQQMPSGDLQHPHQTQNNAFANMTNSHPAASSSGSASMPQAPPPPTDPDTQPGLDPQFDIFEWYPKYQSCQRYFVDHAQQSGHVQAVAAFVNIGLPFQRAINPIPALSTRHSPSLVPPPSPPHHQRASCVSLIPYLRRLVVTGLDFPGVLHGFFGDDWAAGVGPLHEQERRNYLFAAKSGGWASVKKDYDMPPLETVPFMRPLQGPVIAEIEAAEKSWSEWLAMEDWMVGPRAPGNLAHPHEGHEGHQMRR